MHCPSMCIPATIHFKFGGLSWLWTECIPGREKRRSMPYTPAIEDPLASIPLITPHGLWRPRFLDYYARSSLYYCDIRGDCNLCGDRRPRPLQPGQAHYLFPSSMQRPPRHAEERETNINTSDEPPRRSTHPNAPHKAHDPDFSTEPTFGPALQHSHIPCLDKFVHFLSFPYDIILQVADVGSAEPSEKIMLKHTTVHSHTDCGVENEGKEVGTRARLAGLL